MQNYLKEIIEKYPRRIINSTELELQVASLAGEQAWERAGAYEAFAGVVKELVDAGVLIPVKASGSNGRVPPLAARYRLQKKNVKLAPELFNIRSGIDLSYFHRNPGEFSRYYDILYRIDRYLVENIGKLPEVWDTANERSLALVGDEKFLLSAEGTKVLHRINVSLQDLHCYKVDEPFFYRQLSVDPASSKVIYGLIIENKDTFETISRLQQNGCLRLSPSLDIIIYGEGNKITGSWSFLDSIPWVSGKPVRLFYFGDLDPEGINIYCRLLSGVSSRDKDQAGKALKIMPEVKLSESLYSMLLQQEIFRVTGKQASDKDLDNLSMAFKDFSPKLKEEIKGLWKAGRVVPQEALSASRLAERGEVEL